MTDERLTTKYGDLLPLKLGIDTLWYALNQLNKPSLSDEEVFEHYLDIGAKSGLSPNRTFFEKWYRYEYPDVERAIDEQIFISGYHHYVLFGTKGEQRYQNPYEKLGKVFENVEVFSRLLKTHFQGEWYEKKYMDDVNGADLDPLSHYLEIGIRKGFSPNSEFDEKWYCIYYSDVGKAVSNGELLCGFFHYAFVGLNEGRQPKRNLKGCLKERYPGLVNPAGIERLTHLESKLQPVSTVDTTVPLGTRVRINFLLPSINPDIMFGGYKSVIELIKSAHGRGYTLRILICDESHDYSPYFIWSLREASKMDEYEIFSSIEFFNITDRGTSIEVHSRDRFIAYSAWVAHLASGLCGKTDQPHFYFLIQEDETIFHHYDSVRAIVDSAYSLPHVGIFNSKLLYDHFKKIKPCKSFDESYYDKAIIFEHALSEIPIPNAESFKKRSVSRLLFYARPEEHGGRNLFEFGVLALRLAIKEGWFTGDWEFYGIGSLGYTGDIVLSDQYRLKMKEKLPGDQYVKFMHGFDVGLSLMYAPHPSLLPFEMANAGMVTVTNVFDNRPKEWLEDQSGNIIPSELTLDSISLALGVAVERAGEVTQRIVNAENTVNQTFNKTWRNVYNESFWADFDKKING